MPDTSPLPVWLRAQIHADRERHVGGWYGNTHWRMLQTRARLGAWTVSRRNGVTSALSDEIADAGLGYLRELFDQWQADHAKQFIADLDAKLAIVTEYESLIEHKERYPETAEGWGGRTKLKYVLGLIAAPYADRDGYRDEWRP